MTDGGHLAGRVVPRLLAGKPVSVLGDPDAPHSWTYLPDVARALAEVAADERAWGRAWHIPTAPALPIRRMIDLLATEAGVSPVPVRRLHPTVFALAALATPLLRELREVRHQFDAPFTVDTTAYETTFTTHPTPLTTQLRTTTAWWRARLSN